MIPSQKPICQSTCRALSAERFKLTRFYAIIILVIYMRADHALLGFALSAVRID